MQKEVSIVKSSFEIQKIIGSSSSIPLCSGFTKILNIIVIPSDDPSEWQYPRYTFEIDPAETIFNNDIKGSTCFLICQLLDQIGNPFPSEALGIQGATAFGNFFRNFTPQVSIYGQNLIIVRFDFNAGYAAGKLSFNLSNGQNTQRTTVFNIPLSNQVQQPSQTLKINAAQFESGNSNAYSPLIGNEFSEGKNVGSVLTCVLVDDQDNFILPSDYYFSQVSFMTLSNATATVISVLGQSTLVIEFHFNGVLEIGSIIFQIVNAKKGNTFVVDPQVINVPTTGGGS
jgi:hypothetical protein